MARARPPKKKVPGDYHHGDLRRALLDAAVAILGESGAESFTLREAARRTGVDHRAAYRHFADKDALLAAVAAEGYERFLSQAREALERVPEERARDRLLAVARTYVALAYREPARYRVMTGPRLNEDGRFPELEALIQAGVEMIARELRAGIKGGALRAIDPTEATLTLVSAMHGVASFVVMRRIRVRPQEIGAFAERVLGHTVRGLSR